MSLFPCNLVSLISIIFGAIILIILTHLITLIMPIILINPINLLRLIISINSIDLIILISFTLLLISLVYLLGVYSDIFIYYYLSSLRDHLMVAHQELNIRDRQTLLN